MSPQELPEHRIVTHCHCEQFDSLCELASYLDSQMVCRLFDFRFTCLIAMKSLLFTNDLADHRYSLHVGHLV